MNEKTRRLQVIGGFGKGTVKTVNGVHPDKNGNVEIPAGVDVSGAKVGHIIKVASVDETGKPTAWEAVEMPEQKQADWKQNDETAADHVKNRPFYTGDPVETAIVPSMDVSFCEDDGDPWWSELCEGSAVETGTDYTVFWNGTAYDCVGTDLDGAPFIGNPGYLSGEYDDNGMPFCIYERDGILWCGAISPDGDMVCNVRVIGNISEVHKIDSKYIEYPDATAVHMYYGVDDDGNYLTYPVDNVFIPSWEGLGVGEQLPPLYIENGNLYFSEIVLKTTGLEIKIDCRNLGVGEYAEYVCSSDNSDFTRLFRAANEWGYIENVALRGNSGWVYTPVFTRYGATAYTVDGQIFNVNFIAARSKVTVRATRKA